LKFTHHAHVFFAATATAVPEFKQDRFPEVIGEMLMRVGLDICEFQSGCLLTFGPKNIVLDRFYEAIGVGIDRLRFTIADEAHRDDRGLD
jgi:hypothetical protein